MSSPLPLRVDLDDPPENGAALAEVLGELSSGAFSLGVLRAHLTGPVAAAPGWIGEDAAQAVAQISTVAGLVDASHAALTTACSRLDLHAELLADVRRRVSALRAEQAEDFAETQARVLVLDGPDPLSPVTTPGIAADIERLQARDERRRTEQRALLAELDSDAATTARLLADCVALVGGTGASGDGDRVVLRLAAQLPGWGDGELSDRAHALAPALSGPLLTTELERRVEEAAVYATAPAFAKALVVGLGTDGLQFLLKTLGGQPSGYPHLASFLARILCTARPADQLVDPVGDVVRASYVSAEDPDSDADLVALGMGAILAAASRLPGPGLPVGLLTAWGGQILDREKNQGATALQRVPSLAPLVPDSVLLVVQSLTARGDPLAAAQLLAAPGAWSVLLARYWDDRAASLAQLTELAATDPGPAGAAMVRGALEELGRGVSPRDPGPWTVEPANAVPLLPALGRAVTAHLSEVTWMLRQAGEGASLPLDADLALRGLAYVTNEPSARQAIGAALQEWLVSQRESVGDPTGTVPLVAAVSGAYVAVEQYGPRLSDALRGAEERAAAVDRYLALAPVEAAVSCVSLKSTAAGLAALVPQTALIEAETPDIGADDGPVLDSGDAVTAAFDALPPDIGNPRSVVAMARGSFSRTMRALGTPGPPDPQPLSFWRQVLRAVPCVGPLTGPPTN